MTDEKETLTRTLIDCVEAGRMPGTELDYETSATVDAESESTDLTVRFDTQRSSSASLNLRLLLARLEQDTVLSSLDLVTVPRVQLIFLGAVRGHNYRIVVDLTTFPSDGPATFR